jgi:hypothetical protein
MFTLLNYCSILLMISGSYIPAVTEEVYNGTGRIIIQIENLKNQNGSILISLYNNPDGYPEDWESVIFIPGNFCRTVLRGNSTLITSPSAHMHLRLFMMKTITLNSTEISLGYQERVTLFQIMYVDVLAPLVLNRHFLS